MTERERVQKNLSECMKAGLVGIQVMIPMQNSIMPSEHGGNLFLFYMNTTGKIKNGRVLLEIHINKNGEMLVQSTYEDIARKWKIFSWLENSKPKDFKDFVNINEFKERLCEVNEMLPN